MAKVRKVVPYIIKGRPVNVHSEPSSSSSIINALAPETQFSAVSEINGYLKLLYGGYVLKTSNVILDEGKIKKVKTNKILSNLLKNKSNKYTIVANTDNAASNPLDGKIIKVKNTILRDAEGNMISDAYKKDDSSLVLNKINSNGNVTLYDPSNDTYIEIDPSNIEVADPASAKVVKDSEGNETTNYTFKTADEVYEETTGSDMYNYAYEKAFEDAMNNGKSFSGFIDTVASAMSSILPQEKFNIENTRSVFGMPYQFTPITDNRLDGDNSLRSFGRKYAQKIVSRAPIMIMQAGTPVFMKGFSDKEKGNILEGIASDVTGANKMKETLNSAGKYYSFKDASIDYYNGVNQMCRAMGSLLGIGDRSITVNDVTGNISDFNWMSAANKPYFGYYKGAVGFYANAEAQMQDSIANGTRQSALAGQVNQISDQAAELQFILGGVASSGVPIASQVADLVHKDQDKTAKSANKKNSTDSNTGVLGSIINSINTLISGGKLIFPEIWSDSSFTRNYNITIKLDSPDCDTYSIYMNILVPLVHIIGFCLPRYSGTNAYVSPFLVRAYLRSMFHVDMGIITSCEIIRGDTQAWNQDGLPTQVTVQMTIKDLYTVMAAMLSEDSMAQDLISNPAQLDYIANLCGINIAVPDFKRTLMLWYTLRNPETKIGDAVTRAWSGFSGVINRKWENLFNSHWSM